VKIWDIFAAGRAQETFEQSADVVAVAYRPDGLEIAVACLDGTITFWNIQLGLVASLTNLSLRWGKN